MEPITDNERQDGMWAVILRHRRRMLTPTPMVTVIPIPTRQSIRDSMSDITAVGAGAGAGAGANT